ncbi:MAG: hypothetical protein U5K56_19255 [Halioglobus sp.]|nr:hypothetical protein [Halioglobus sp.]
MQRQLNLASLAPGELLTAFVRQHLPAPPPQLVAHRAVHGGARLASAHAGWTPAVEVEIERIAPLAPLHDAMMLAWLRACRAEVLGCDGMPRSRCSTRAFTRICRRWRRPLRCPMNSVRGANCGATDFTGFAHQALLGALARLAPGRRGRRSRRLVSSSVPVARRRRSTMADPLRHPRWASNRWRDS